MRGLYLVTDRKLCGDRSLEYVVSRALEGGVAYLQLREKDLSTRLFVEVAREMKALTDRYRVPLIINDRIDVALAVEADGVHIGQDDMPYSITRKLMGPRAIIGVSVETWDDVVMAQQLDVNYIAVSPVFETPTKTNTKSYWGLEGLARIKAYSRHPVVGIGGLNASNAEEMVTAGADCIAVVSAICSDPYPLQASRKLHDIIHASLKKRPV